VRTYNEKGS